jgi:ferredoxin
VALDAVATAIVGLPPRRIGTTRIAADRGLGEARLPAIQIRGPSVAELRVPRFRLPSRMLFAATIFDRLPSLLVEPATGLATLGRERPELVAERCTGCGECVTACPEGGLRLRNGVVELDPERCTPCFACVEACPTEALERGWNRAGQVTHGLTTAVNRTRRRVKRFLGLRR